MHILSNNLNLFKTLFLVKGILTLCFSLFFVAYAFFGSYIGHVIETNNHNDPIPFSLGTFFIVIGSFGFFITVTMGILTLFASKYLKEVKNYNFIFVISILNCLTGILGILLGVFTIIELNKPHVKELFNKE